MTNNQTKMIIITSNEDLIQQFSLNQSDNTRIIDLDENNSASTDNNNLVDLNFLVQLSEYVCIYLFIQNNNFFY